MRIKRIDINGFKSFCEPTRIAFEQPLTAVVGPNGCGKSNIVDSIRWCLGEQSARTLRGKGMEDVIFNGSETRGPLSMAEVSITFDNDDGLSHPAYVEYPEISVARRLHRDGTSEYLINKNQCRRRDITDLFMGTGGGARAYSIIEQGRIGLIVSSRSEERRAMIDEAAGVTKYKASRRTASRKMEQTRQQLLRVTDVVAEMERSLGSLKTQAQKAKRFKRYRGEQRDLELYQATHRYLELRAGANVATAALSESEVAQAEAREALGILEARVESLRLEEHRARADLDGEKSASFENDGVIQSVEGEVRRLLETMDRFEREEESLFGQRREAFSQIEGYAKERLELESRRRDLERASLEVAERREKADRLVSEVKEALEASGSEYDAKRDRMSRVRARMAAAESAVESLGTRISEASARMEDTRAEERDLRACAEDLERRVTALEGRSTEVEGALTTALGTVETETEAFEGLRKDLDACDEERQRVRDELQAKTSRLSSLREMSAGLERHDIAVREAVVRLGEEGEIPIDGLLVDFVDCPERFEKALAAALADELQALLVEDHESGVELLGWLRDRQLGRVTVLPRTLPRRVGGKEPPAEGEGVIGRLVDCLEGDPEVLELVAALVGDVAVVERSESLLDFWKERGSAAVSLDGQLVDGRGVLRGGRSGSPGADLLGQKREIRELEVEVEKLRDRHEELEDRFDEVKRTLIGRRDAADEARREAQQHEVVLAETRKDRSRASEDLEQARLRLEGLSREIARQEEMLEQMRGDRDQAVEESVRSEREIEALERGIAEQSAEIAALRERLEGLVEEASDARVLGAENDQQRQSVEDRLRQIEFADAEARDRSVEIDRRRMIAAEEIGKAAGEAYGKRQTLADHLDRAEILRRNVTGHIQRLDGATARLGAAEEELKACRAELSEIGDRVSSLRVDLKEATLAVDHLLDAVAQRHDTNLLRVVGDHHLRPIPGEEVQARIDELKRLIERMGSINPTAIEEYEATLERYEERVKHKADVEQALEDLERTIAKLDRDSKRLFKEAFERVDDKFQKIFPRLFEGGRASLVLTDKDDLLNTGVDIVAQPPGKQLTHIELMSGGEKALTAVSLLFAIFLHKPSPFCLLDEVDAPFDEANVGRFIDMVRELTDRSQFIIITHSKVTMEGSDSLCGITMEEPGVSKIVSVRLVPREKEAAATG